MDELLNQHHSDAIVTKHHDPPKKKMGIGTSAAAGTRWFARRFPRLFYFILQLVLPLLVLIAMAFLFGWALASVESPEELEANDATLRGSYNQYIAYQNDRWAVQEAIQTGPDVCLTSYYSDNATTTTAAANQEDQQLLRDHLNQCAANFSAQQFPVLDFSSFFGTILDTGEVDLTFEWSRCALFDFTSALDANTSAADRNYLISSAKAKQTTQFIIDFFVDFEQLNSQATEDKEDYRRNLELATGSKSCKPHTAGGAVFWFTIMTTIGYGNVAPATDAGRLLIYTCGFVSVIGFLYLNASASQVLLTLVDDALIRIRLRWLTRGMPSCVFWLVLLVGWIFVLAGTAMRWSQQEIGYDFPFKDASWFSYITILTIGLGDYHIAHEDFKPNDMFYIPLVVLLGFVVLGNFAAKLSATVSVWFPIDDTLETILKATQPKEEEEWTLSERFRTEQERRDKERSSSKQRIRRRKSF